MSKCGKLSLLILLILGLFIIAIGCGEPAESPPPNPNPAPAPTTTVKDNSKILSDRALQVVASTPRTGADYSNNGIYGTDLAKKLADPNEKAKLLIVDVRSKADYDKGHIQGAVQIDFGKWAAPENINKLPSDKKIIVVCYTGNTAAQAAMGMRMLGYDAAVLRGGMNGWAQGGGQASVVSDLQKTDYPIVTTPAGPSLPAPAQTNFDKPAGSDLSVLQQTAASIMNSMPTSGDYNNNTIPAAKLSDKLANAQEKDKLFLLDTRQTADYNTGHIDGTINVPFPALAVPDNLKMLPKEKKIVVVDYTGLIAGQEVTMLRMLGYDAVVLKYGMMAWDGAGKDVYLKDIQSANNPVVSS